MTLRQALEPEELLAQLGWLNALARQVAPDPHLADDLTQAACLVALSPAAERPRSVRRWLASVVRNLGRTLRRGERRRARREAGSARVDLAPSTVELLERAAVHQALVDELLRLEEPYRTTLLLRFIEERSVREVAARTDVPESTVATRTAEGLRRLRVRLSRGRRGGAFAWLPSLFPSLRAPPRALPAAASIGISTMATSKLALGTSVLVVAFLAYRAFAPSGPAAEEPAVGGAREPTSPVVAAQPARDAAAPVDPELGARSPQDAPAVHAAPAHTAGAARVTRGRVIDFDGAPVGGVDVCCIRLASDPHRAHATSDATPCALSDAAGAFEIEGLPPFRLVVRSARYTTLFEGLVYTEAAEQEPVVIVAYRLPLAGVVVDEDDAPVAGALVRFAAPGRVLALPGNLLGASEQVVPETRSDEHGRFAFAEAPDLPGAVLSASAPGFLPAATTVPPGGSEYLRVLLRRPALGSGIAGHVVFADGRPAPAAFVSLGRRVVLTDEQGAFVLDLEHLVEAVAPDRPLVLTAAFRGCLPALETLPSPAQAEELGWPTDLVLQLGGPTATIRGLVVDEAGRPLRGIAVEALDAVDFGLVPEPGTSYFLMRTREEIAGGGTVFTDARGRFELVGLSQRSYRLAALEEASLLTAVTPPVEAGSTDVRVVLDRRALGRLAGRVVDRDGLGIEGVRVAVSRRGRSRLPIGTSATTDVDGKFELSAVATPPQFLRLEGEEIVPEIFRELPPEADLEALELRVARRCYLQVEWDRWRGRADELRLVGERDAPLELLDLEGGGTSPRRSIDVGEGLSTVFAIPDSARHAVLFSGGREVERIALRPVAGGFELLRL